MFDLIHVFTLNTIFSKNKYQACIENSVFFRNQTLKHFDAFIDPPYFCNVEVVFCAT